MRKRNWHEYNRRLVERGSLTFLIDRNVLRMLKRVQSKSPGRPMQFPDKIIELLATVKIHFKLTYRALQGFADSFLRHLFPARKAPNYTLVCKRLKNLGRHLPILPANRNAVVVLDASGMKVYGEGEWKVKMHGRGRPRKWVKVHLAIDVDTQEIVAEVVTEAVEGDSKMARHLLDQLKHSPKEVLADGGYDKSEVRELLTTRKIKQLIPPPKNAKWTSSNRPRDHAILEILGLGGDRVARTIWAKLTGYNRRVLAETAFSRLKRLFGERFFSKALECQRVESRLRCCVLNRMRVCS
jgi:hypothetical protein